MSPLTRSKKRKNEENIHSDSLPKRQQYSQSININKLMENPGFSHITEKILLCLDHKTLQAGQLVCHLWKNQLDQPLLWIKVPIIYFFDGINRVSSFSRYLNGTFPWRNCSILDIGILLTQMRKVTSTNLFLWVNLPKP